MGMLVTDSLLSDRLIEERRRRGADRYDEVWEGMYVMHAYPADEHQKVVNRLSVALTYIIEDAGIGEVRPGVNLASDASDWQHDYRCPDVVVFLHGSSAVCHGAFWTGAPALVVEIVSPDDQTREKIDFYAKVGTRELLIVDRDPWRLELRRHDGRGLPVAAVGEINGAAIASESLPITLQLVSGDDRPRIVVKHGQTGRQWTV